MGIPGLTTYIAQNADVYFENYYLHNTYLVVDGNSIASQLYTNEAKCNSCFGGDYDKYAFCVSNFFDELLKCNVTPLIIIDGGAPDKKISTLYKRLKDRILTASILAPYKQTRSQLFPLLLKEVFKDVALQKGIKCSNSLFEADEDIASVARILNCPVLSFDSDFFIFDVMYIPFNTLNDGIMKNRSGDGYVKNCKVYRIDHFLRNFRYLDRSLMPLAATLLGNDYIDIKTFQNFFYTLKFSKLSNKRYNEQQRRIDAVFRWLQNHTLDSAISIILSKLDPKKREQILLLIEMIINGYLNASFKMLYPLGFSSHDINCMMQRFPNKTYKFQQDCFNLDVTHEPMFENESNLFSNVDDANDIDQDLEIVIPDDENRLHQIAPSWFINEFNCSKFPAYFIDMLKRQLYLCPVQIEDFSRPTCINISLKIISVIFRLLNIDKTNSQILEYVTRGKLIDIKTFRLQCDNYIFNFKLPSLLELPKLPPEIREEILNNTLGVNKQLLLEFPPAWRLYIATAKYWLDETDAPFGTNCHLYAVLFAMLFSVIDKNIGFHRSEIFFKRKFSSYLDTLEQNQSRTATNYPVQNMSIYNAFNAVNKDDCLLAAPFFLQNFVIDQGIMKNPKKFHISTVHAFSLFQSCLRHSSHLNALLGCPYIKINYAEFFNGTLLYNLYNNFKSRTDIDLYITNILQKSPSLLQLFVSLVTTSKSLFTKVFENKVNSGRRKKHKNRKSNDTDMDEPIEELVESTVQYYDANNKFSALNLQNFAQYYNS